MVSHQGGRILVELKAGVTSSTAKSNLTSAASSAVIRVAIEASAPTDEHRVMAILPRDNLLQRVDGFGQVRAMAANISQLLVCLSQSLPEPNFFLLDQYLLSAEQQQYRRRQYWLTRSIYSTSRGGSFRDCNAYTGRWGIQIVVSTSVKSGQGMDRFRQLAARNQVICVKRRIGRRKIIADPLVAT